MKKRDLVKINDCLWEIPRGYRSDMRVPGRIFTSERMLESILGDRSLAQLVNVATLPGIRKWAVAMPDIHEGYGFPIGGVAAVDADDGVISPGGIGYDINCGVRLLRTPDTLAALQPRLKEIAHSLAREIPSGVGRGGRLVLKPADMDRVLLGGAQRAVEMGHGEPTDLDHIESRGTIEPADAKLVSDTAKERGHDQLGTIGSGNHFVEIDVVDTVFDADDASRFGLQQGQIVVLIHTGSRGLGHQVATDHLRTMASAMQRYRINVPDRELACVPINSLEGQRYLRAMAAAANFAFANRQMIAAGVRRVWKHDVGSNVETVYDIAHNIAKVEEHDGARLIVHRKGATKAFPGQPVLIPGSMGTASYVLVGQDAAMRESFGSSCHGAGRVMSRMQAKRQIDGHELRDRMAKMGIATEAGSLKGLVEEAPEAYKDVDAVVDVVHRAGIAKKVVRLRPVAVVKG